MDTGRSRGLYFINGRPDGMPTAALFDWTGHVVKTPHTLIKQARGRDQASQTGVYSSQTGVYFLRGVNDSGPLAYIDETGDMAKRLKNHVVKKGWWKIAVLISETGNKRHKTHVKYQESRRVELVLMSKRIPLLDRILRIDPLYFYLMDHIITTFEVLTQNMLRSRRDSNIEFDPLEKGNTPPHPNLSEAARANMKRFLDNLLMILPTLGADMFTDKVRNTAHIAPFPPVAVFEAHQAKGDIHATAILHKGEVISQMGSTVRQEWVGKPGDDVCSRIMRPQLNTNGILATGTDGRLHSTQDYAFFGPNPNPGVGATVVVGRSACGPREWNLKDSTKTSANWEVAQLKDIA